MIEVVAAYLEIDNKVLIAKRTYGDGPAIGKWEFPGGKINEGETPEEALIREMKEEMDIEVSVLSYICDHIEKLPTRTIHLNLYKCSKISGDIKINSEHIDYALVSKDEIEDYDLVPADRMLFNKARNML